MNTDLRKSLHTGWFQATLVSALLLVPLVSQAQSTFFGSGGASNTAPDTDNLAFGYQALFSNTTGSYNTAQGLYSLLSNTTGANNTANGVGALYFNTIGSMVALGVLTAVLPPCCSFSSRA